MMQSHLNIRLCGTCAMLEFDITLISFLLKLLSGSNYDTSINLMSKIDKTKINLQKFDRDIIINLNLSILVKQTMLTISIRSKS